MCIKKVCEIVIIKIWKVTLYEFHFKQKKKVITMSIWIKMSDRSFLRWVCGVRERCWSVIFLKVKSVYITRDKKYTITAITVTMRRFGPSGSSKKKNIVREQMREDAMRVRRGILEEEEGIVISALFLSFPFQGSLFLLQAFYVFPL